MNRDHYLAVKARLEADAQLNGRVQDVATITVGLERRTSFVVLFGGSPSELGADRLYKSQEIGDNAVYDFTVRSVAANVASVFETSQRVQNQLIGWIPAIAGRRCRAVRLSGTDSMRADNSVKPPVYYIDDEFELRSFFTGEA